MQNNKNSYDVVNKLEAQSHVKVLLFERPGILEDKLNKGTAPVTTAAKKTDSNQG